MLRIFYLLVFLLNLLIGIWMLFFPLSWYTDFPAAIPHTGPFNPHFVRDLGIVFLTVACAFAWCARHLSRSRPIHLGLTIFFTGHAMLHLYEILTGRMPESHWLIDTPGVFLPALLMIVLTIPSVRKRLGEIT